MPQPCLQHLYDRQSLVAHLSERLALSTVHRLSGNTHY